MQISAQISLYPFSCLRANLFCGDPKPQRCPRSLIEEGGKAMSQLYREPFELLSNKTIEIHRACVSLIEEIEAMDGYQQRIDATQDDALKKSSNKPGRRKKNTPVCSWSGSAGTMKDWPKT